MASLEAEVIILGTSALLTYLTVYRFNKFFGSILITILGVGIFTIDTTTPYKIAGIITFFAGLISTIWSITPKEKTT